MLKRLLAVGLLVGAVASLGLAAGPAFSADNGAVNATVTVATPCLTVPSTTINYGTKSFATVNTGESTSTGPELSIGSCSEAPQFLAVRGDDMVSNDMSAAWTLSSMAETTTCFQDGAGAASTVDRYKHELTYGPNTPPSSVLLTKSLGTLGIMSGIGTGWNITPHLYMPCSGSGGVGQTMNTIIIFTAYY
ncbi:MAG TPA: hypothetical protein VIH05_09755 [Tepidiformaceae bacterium]